MLHPGVSTTKREENGGHGSWRPPTETRRARKHPPSGLGWAANSIPDARSRLWWWLAASSGTDTTSQLVSSPTSPRVRMGRTAGQPGEQCQIRLRRHYSYKVEETERRAASGHTAWPYVIVYVCGCQTAVAIWAHCGLHLSGPGVNH